MIYGTLSTVSAEYAFLPQALQKVLGYLKNCDFAKIENKRYDIEGENMFMVVREYATEALADKKAEQHRDYIDVQHMISGEECMGLGYESDRNTVLSKYNPEKDCINYRDIEHEVYIPFVTGMYGIFFPTDIHRPGLNFDSRQTVRKAIIKISVKLLD